MERVYTRSQFDLRWPRLKPRFPVWYERQVLPASSRATFSERVLEHVDALYAFAYRLTRDATQSEDLVQDTFARAMAAAEQFQPNSNLRSWLFRILRNVYIDEWRRTRRDDARRGHADAHEVSTEDASTEPLRNDIELDRLRSVVAEDIEAALFELSEEARSVILLDLEGFSEAEVAEVMGCAQGTVKSRLARARAILRQRLAEYAK